MKAYLCIETTLMLIMRKTRQNVKKTGCSILGKFQKTNTDIFSGTVRLNL